MNPRKPAFTLMETLLAISVVAILLTTFLAVFGPATTGIRRAISVQDADRLASALEKELSILTDAERGSYETAFAKAYEWIESSDTLTNAIILFNYRGDTSNIIDGELEAYTDELGNPGQDYIIQPSVSRLGSDDIELEQRLEAVEGRAFAVRMRQLVRGGSGALVPAQPGSGIVSTEGASSSGVNNFEEAVIAFQAEFYLLPANSYAYITGPLAQGGDDFERTLGKPLFTRNMAVRR
ncbi:MAG: type II secretion system protein [Verrucomicrobiota bacterium]